MDVWTSKGCYVLNYCLEIFKDIDFKEVFWVIVKNGTFKSFNNEVKFGTTAMKIHYIILEDMGKWPRKFEEPAMITFIVRRFWNTCSF